MTIGKHLIIQITGIRDSVLLEKIEGCKQSLDTIIQECDLHVVAEVGYQFEPKGFTYAYVLSESHMTIHTYPEYGYAYMDIFCCNKEFSQKKAIECIKRVFQTESVNWELLHR